MLALLTVKIVASQLNELFLRTGITGESAQLNRASQPEHSWKPNWPDQFEEYGGDFWRLSRISLWPSRGNCGKTNQGRFGESDLFVNDVFLVKEDTKLVSKRS